MVHTLNMNIFPKAVDAPKPLSKEAVYVALFQAGVLVIIILAQLFTYEDMLAIFSSMYLADATNTHLIASSLVAAEVFSLPFLLRLRLSPAMRVFSMLLLWIVSSFWFLLGVLLPLKEPAMTSTGLMGGLVDVSFVPLIIFGSVFAMLTIITSWGMWPLVKKSRWGRLRSIWKR